MFREALSPSLALRMSAFTHNLCCASQRLTVHATVFFVVGRDTGARWVGTFLCDVHAILLFDALDLLIKGYSIHLFDAELRKDDAGQAACS